MFKFFRDTLCLQKVRQRVSYLQAQSLAEYAILLGVVVAAIMAMQVYTKIAIKKAVKLSTDQIGSQSYVLSPGVRYSTGDVSSESNLTEEDLSNQSVFLGGRTRADINVTSELRGTASADYLEKERSGVPGPCKAQICEGGYYWNFTECACKCMPADCPGWTHEWDPALCKCVCKPQECESVCGANWDVDTCRCTFQCTNEKSCLEHGGTIDCDTCNCTF